MLRALLIAWPTVVACNYVARPLELQLDDWHKLMDNASTANVDQVIQSRMRDLLAELFDAEKAHQVGKGDLSDPYHLPDFTLDSDPHHAATATKNSVVVNNTNSPVLQHRVGNVKGHQASAHTRLQLTIEFVTDAQISMRKHLPILGNLEYIDQTVRVHVMFSGTVLLRAALNLSEPRIELVGGKQRVVFDFDVSLTTESVKWEIVAVTAENDTCQVVAGGARIGFCSRVESMFRDRDFVLKKEIIPVATERAVLRFRDHIRAVVGPIVAIPINVKSPSLLIA